MAKLPRYTSQQNMTTQPATAQRSVGSELLESKALGQLGASVQEVAGIWQRAEEFSMKLNKSQNMQEGTQALESGFAGYNDFNSVDDIKNELAKYQEQANALQTESMTGFANNNTKMEFGAEVKSHMNGTMINLEKMARTKMIDFTKGDIMRANNTNKNGFIMTGDPAYKQYQKAIIRDGEAFLDYKDKVGFQMEVDSWDSLRYLQKAGEGDLDGAYEDVKNNPNMSATEKASAFSSIQTIAKQSNMKMVLESTMSVNKRVDDTYQAIKNPQLSYVDKLDLINKQEKFVDKGSIDIMKNYIDSTDIVMAKTYPNTISQLQLGLAKFQKGLTAKSDIKDIKEYLDDVNKTRLSIMTDRAKGRLTDQHEDMLLDELDEYAQFSYASASKKLESLGSDAPIWAPTPIGRKIYGLFDYGYDNAHDDFMSNFNDNSASTDLAMMEYFNQSYKKDLDEEQKKELVNTISDGIHKDIRETIRNTLLSNNPDLSRRKPETDAQAMARHNATEQDVKATMDKHGVTRKEVINRLRNS